MDAGNPIAEPEMNQHSREHHAQMEKPRMLAALRKTTYRLWIANRAQAGLMTMMSLIEKFVNVG